MRSFKNEERKKSLYIKQSSSLLLLAGCLCHTRHFSLLSFCFSLSLTVVTFLRAPSVHVGEADFPQNLPTLFGPLDPTAGCTSLPNPATASGSSSAGINGGNLNNSSDRFPHNVKFVTGNYVLESEDLLDSIVPEFDVITCLSTTKWMHLNFGDEGMKRAFKRMHAHLRPGGMLILEAQSMASYKKKKKLTARIFENFQNIKFRPDQFSDYLLHEVGFSTGFTIAIPNHSSKGFQRPLQVNKIKSFVLSFF